jgi:glycosyltransferase involved in cell wall biosynthesis
MSEVPVTIAVPIYNGARFLAEAIQSLLAQSERRFRLICVDDASTDDSVRIASSFPDDRMIVIAADTHVSLAENWNRALDAVDTPYFVVAHQDDIYEPTYLATMLGVIGHFPRAFAVHCKASTIDESGHPSRLASGRYKETFWPSADPYEREPADEIAVLGRGNYVIAPSVLFRTSAARRIGSFDPSLQFVPDWQYWLRGLKLGFTLAGTHARLIRFRRHAWSATRATELSLRRYEEEIALLQWLEAPSFSLVEKTLISDFAARLAADDGEGARALLAFGQSHIPRFRGSVRSAVLRAVLPAGAAGGRLLDTMARIAIELSIARHRLIS